MNKSDYCICHGKVVCPGESKIKMNNAKEIAEKILNQKYVNQLEVTYLDVNTLARNYLDTINGLETDNTYIPMLEKRMIELNNSNQELKSEITKLKEENETLSKDLKMCREIGVEMQRKVNRKLSDENEKLKKSREVLRKAVEFYGNESSWSMYNDSIRINRCDEVDSEYSRKTAGKKAREAIKADDEIFETKEIK